MFVAQRDEKMMLIAIYVDDIILATNDEVWLHDVKRQLSNSFEMKGLWQNQYLFGYRIFT